jgi:hypothetical protein
MPKMLDEYPKSREPGLDMLNTAGTRTVEKRKTILRRTVLVEHYVLIQVSKGKGSVILNDN